MREFYIVDETTDENLSTELLERIVSALDDGQRDLGPWWQCAPLPVIAGGKVEIPTDPSIVIVTWQDQLRDPNALAYHTLDEHGRPRVFVGWGIIRSNGGTPYDGAVSLSCITGHELAEARVDPDCSFLVDMPDGRTETPLEVCDWTQGDFYVRNSCALPNFVGPRAFVQGGPGPFDYMGLMTKPFDLRPGGYWSTRVGGPGGEWSDTFGEKMPTWMREAKKRKGTRYTRRREPRAA